MNEEAAIRFLILIVEGEEGAGNPEVDLARIAIPYYAFRDFGSEVVLATLTGGPPLIADNMRSADMSNEAVRRFRADRHARDDSPTPLPLIRS